MSKITFRALASIAGLALVVAPIAVAANTRAGDNSSGYGAQGASQSQGTAAAGQDDDDDDGAGFLLGAAGIGAVVVGILVATDVIGGSDNGDASPGT